MGYYKNFMTEWENEIIVDDFKVISEVERIVSDVVSDINSLCDSDIKKEHAIEDFLFHIDQAKKQFFKDMSEI
jgi:hypothetical protein